MFLEEKSIFHGSLSFLWLRFLWELYLSIRQHRIYKDVQTVPSELQEAISEETFEKARLYALDCSVVNRIIKLTRLIFTTEILLLDGISFFWKFGTSIMAKLGYEAYHEILDSVVFFLIISTFNTLFDLLFSVYITFILEEKYGFNKQTFGFFIKDQMKAYVVYHMIVLPLIVAFIYIVKTGGDYFLIYLYLLTVVIGFMIITIYPIYIAPLFDKYTQLPEGNLKTEIEKLTTSIGFPLDKLYVAEGSKRSGHSNAYLYGFFNSKSIVLYDTLLQDYAPENESVTLQDDVTSNEKNGCDNDEVLAVLGHEFGHWKLNHLLKFVIIHLLDFFLVFVVFGLLYKYEPMYCAFGFHDEKPVVIGMIIVMDFILLPYRVILDFLCNLLTRHFEFQADAFAKSLGKSQFLRHALIKLYKDNLLYPVYDWLYSIWHHSHPPLLERLTALEDKED